MYALVGKATIGKPTLASGFLWKRGFLAHQRQCTPTSHAPNYEKAKEPEEIAGLDVLLARYLDQQKIAIRNPSDPSATTKQAIDWAILPAVCRLAELLYTIDARGQKANEELIIISANAQGNDTSYGLHA